MQTLPCRPPLFALVAMCLSACGPAVDVADAGAEPDAGPIVDAGTGGATDAAVLDASVGPDAAFVDASWPDASTPDASWPDASWPDASAPDASWPDASTPDAAPLDAGYAGFDAGTVTFVEPVQAPAVGLTNVSFDLEALLEDGTLDTACAAYAQDPADEALKLKCGKWMFFYEGFGTLGVPAPLMDFISAEFEDEIGLGQSGLGLIPDPYADIPRPLGLGQGAPTGSVSGYAYTCAACHFGQLPDGRYAVGAANHDYDYGGQTLSIFFVPTAIQPGFNPAEHDPAAMARVQPMIDKLENNPLLKWSLLFDLLPLVFASDGAPPLTLELEQAYVSWPPGTLDFIMSPLPLDDNVHTVSKIIPLWDLPTPEERQAFGLETEQLAWTGGAEALMDFLHGFVDIGGGPADEWTDARMQPLHDYIMSLRSPEPLEPADPVLAEIGENVFVGAGCMACHDGPRGESTTTYEYSDIGTDAAMTWWGDGTPLLTGGEIPWGIKAPRLFGLHGQGRFLHNGSVETLEQLLCMAPRPQAEIPNASTGHTYGCDLQLGDKRALVSFLRGL